MTQFICKDNKISWDDNIGKPIYFYFNDKRHKMVISDRINKNYFNIIIDDTIYKKSSTGVIKNISFDKIFYEPNYLYNIGDIINNKILIIDRFQKEKLPSTSGKTCREKVYRCKCLIDGYIFEIREYELKNKHGCPVCSNKVIIKGINDISSTDSDLVNLFVNPDDAYTHSRKSMSIVQVRCPLCGQKRYMRISDLTRSQRVICHFCSDGVSYPNKFAHSVFNQLSDQYKKYIYEYRPKWADKYRYDNYVVLKDDTGLIFEMDGGFHKLEHSKFSNNDKVKDELAYKNHIKIIRIDCAYDKTENCFSFIKNNVIKCLSKYFDLSNINWNLCNQQAMSNFVYEIAEYYKSNPKLGLDDISKHFRISEETLYNYLHIAEKLGICTYIRNDPNRRKNSKPIAMYDLDENMIGIYRSANIIESKYPEYNLLGRSIRNILSKGKHVYKNFYFRYASFDEYANFN